METVALPADCGRHLGMARTVCAYFPLLVILMMPIS